MIITNDDDIKYVTRNIAGNLRIIKYIKKYSSNTNKCRNGVKEFSKVGKCQVTVI